MNSFNVPYILPAISFAFVATFVFFCWISTPTREEIPSWEGRLKNHRREGQKLQKDKVMFISILSEMRVSQSQWIFNTGFCLSCILSCSEEKQNDYCMSWGDMEWGNYMTNLTTTTTTSSLSPLRLFHFLVFLATFQLGLFLPFIKLKLMFAQWKMQT